MNMIENYTCMRARILKRRRNFTVSQIVFIKRTRLARESWFNLRQ